MRLADGSALDAWLTDKGTEKSSVSLQNRGLPDQEAVEERRAHWGERLKHLAGLIEKD